MSFTCCYCAYCFLCAYVSSDTFLHLCCLGSSNTFLHLCGLVQAIPSFTCVVLLQAIPSFTCVVFLQASINSSLQWSSLTSTSGELLHMTIPSLQWSSFKSYWHTVASNDNSFTGVQHCFIQRCFLHLFVLACYLCGELEYICDVMYAITILWDGICHVEFVL